VTPTPAVDLLLRAPGSRDQPLVLLRRRPPFTPDAGRWELPGGFRHGTESPAQTALRTAAEGTGLDPGRIRIRGERTRPAGGAPTTVIADTAEPMPTPAAELAWVPEPEVASRRLRPDLGAHWPALRAPGTVLVVDAANVVGSRPDGWWRDRAGAAEKLLRELAAAGPGTFPVPDGFRWVIRPVAVLEGMARQAPDVPGVAVIRAAGSGDDTIADVAGTAGDCVVVTADRGLRARLPPGARTVGPSTLRHWLGALSR
jgi:8-oxo-dGTP diphosphatase